MSTNRGVPNVLKFPQGAPIKAGRIRCFLLEESEDVIQAIEYNRLGCGGDPNLFHDMRRTVRVDKQPIGEETQITITRAEILQLSPPTIICSRCQAVVTIGDNTPLHAARRWKRTDTGEFKDRIADFGPGAMWYATWYRGSEEQNKWMEHEWDNCTTPPLIVQTPGGDWNIDSRASNCTLKDDRLHRCWIRHGDPPNITVDKKGQTCQAGAGSIQCGSYHGFLRDGYLVQ